jgi:KAP family P-loop domain
MVVGGFKKSPFFVLVDELDRCRPTYAVELLERIKHLFDVDGIVFVVATDAQQLQCSVRALYGTDFDANRYLRRFFDQSFHFETPRISDFVAAKFFDIDQSKRYGAPDLTPVEFAARAFQSFGLALRDIEQCLDILANCVTVWKQPCPLVLVVLLPLVVAQQQNIPADQLNGADISRNRGHKPWRVDLGVWDQREKRIFDGWGTAANLSKAATDFDLGSSVSENAGSSVDEKLKSAIFGQELRARFPQGYRTDKPPKSVIPGYPALVRSAGRLSLSPA